jgi:hypothetical protein
MEGFLATEPMSSSDRKRLLELALKRNTVHQIAARMCLSYDRVRKMIQRAETLGDVPVGTLRGCGVIPRQIKSRSA